MWAENSVFYQIYPLGLCGAPRVNDGVPAHRISRVESWLDHIVRLGADAIVCTRYATSAVMQTIADECGLKFEMGDYDEATGKTSYRFTK